MVSARRFCGEVVRPNPVLWVFATSRISSLGEATCWPWRYFIIAPTSPNVSVKSRSASETSIALPVTPRWSAAHSSSLKSVFVAISVSDAELGLCGGGLAVDLGRDLLVDRLG